MMKLKILLPVLLIFFGITLSGGLVFAQPCPVCVIAVGAGLGLSRWLGIDDAVSSVWIGAMLLAIVWWCLIWLRKKNWDFKFSGTVIFILIYIVFTFIPLYFLKIAGHPQNTIFGIDKIIFGTVIGTVILWAGIKLNEFLKSKNQGKVFFPYQRVVVPVGCLLLISILIFFLLKI